MFVDFFRQLRNEQLMYSLMFERVGGEREERWHQINIANRPFSIAAFPLLFLQSRCGHIPQQERGIWKVQVLVLRCTHILPPLIKLN